MSALWLPHSTNAAGQIGSLGNVLWLGSFKESLVRWRKKSFFNRHLAHCTFISFDYKTASNTYISRAKLIIFHDLHDSNSIFMQQFFSHYSQLRGSSGLELEFFLHPFSGIAQYPNPFTEHVCFFLFFLTLELDVVCTLAIQLNNRRCIYCPNL